MRTGLRRASVGAVIGGVLASVVVFVPSAEAAVTPLTLDCDTVIPGGGAWSDVGLTTSLDVTAPVAAPTGSAISFTATLAGAPRSLPVALTDARVTTSSFTFSVVAPGKPEIGVTAASDAGSPGPLGNLSPSETLSPPAPGAASFQPAAPYEPGDQLAVSFVQATYTLQFDDVGGSPTTATIVCKPRSGTPDPTSGAYSYAPRLVAQVALYGEPIANPVSDCVAPCSTQQNVFAEVTPGALTQQALQDPANPSATQVELGDVTTDAVGQNVSAPMNPIRVSDARGGTYGWSLTATLTGPFDSGTGGSITEANLTMGATTCAPLAGSAAVIGGSAGAFGGAAHTVATVGAGVIGGAGSGGGQYDCAANLTLTVPPFQRAGDYTTTMTLTLT